MELVVDSNCLMSALIKEGKSRELIASKDVILYAPDHLLIEILKHKDEVIERTGMSDSNFDLLLAILLEKIIFIPEEELRPFKDEALSLVTHLEDAPFMALTLLKKIPLWSDDKDLGLQSKVKVYNTSELLELLDKI